MKIVISGYLEALGKNILEKVYGGLMKYELMNNNKVFLNGIVVEPPTFSHETYGEGFYEVKISVPRLSEHIDVLPIVVLLFLDLHQLYLFYLLLQLLAQLLL